jgi:MbtH protein
MATSGEGTTHYRVVVNEEEQYALWPAVKDIPAGWRDTGEVGPKEQTLSYVERVWTDMRPLSLRRVQSARE